MSKEENLIYVLEVKEEYDKEISLYETLESAKKAFDEKVKEFKEFYDENEINEYHAKFHSDHVMDETFAEVSVYSQQVLK